MKVTNTRKINERITRFLEREELNNLISMGVSAPVSIDKIVVDDYADLKRCADEFQRNMKADGIEYTVIIPFCIRNSARQIGAPAL